jgi:hypothetical protein
VVPPDSERRAPVRQPRHAKRDQTKEAHIGPFNCYPKSVPKVLDGGFLTATAGFSPFDFSNSAHSRYAWPHVNLLVNSAIA